MKRLLLAFTLVIFFVIGVFALQTSCRQQCLQAAENLAAALRQAGLDDAQATQEASDYYYNCVAYRCN